MLGGHKQKFVYRTLAEWPTKQGLLNFFTRLDKPNIETFNVRFREESLNAYYSLSMADAKRIIEAW